MLRNGDFGKMKLRNKHISPFTNLFLKTHKLRDSSSE